VRPQQCIRNSTFQVIVPIRDGSVAARLQAGLSGGGKQYLFTGGCKVGSCARIGGEQGAAAAYAAAAPFPLPSFKMEICCIWWWILLW
jgi:hypothetical protein